MIQYIFKVVVVERGQEALWRGWVTPTRGSRQFVHSALHRNSVGRFEMIEAHDMEEAVQITQRRYPDCTVMREGSERICTA